MNSNERNEEQAVIGAARAAMDNAYCPYSKYPVGAAVRDGSGNIHVGCNVENAALGSTLCAEAGALASAVASGARQFTHVAVVTRDAGMPCGNCRQLMMELAPDAVLLVASVDQSKDARSYAVADLLPEAFSGPASIGDR